MTKKPTLLSLLRDSYITETPETDCKDVYISSTDAFGVSSLDFDCDDITLFYDFYSKRYFKSTVSKVLQAQYHLNRNYCFGGGSITLNEFYEFLGIDPVENGDVIGWQIDISEIMWIDFVNETRIINGNKVGFISFLFEPEPLREIYI